MAIQIPSRSSQYNILNSNTAYDLAQGNSIQVSNANGVFLSDAIHDDKLVIHGSIDQSGGNFAGIWTDGSNIKIEVHGTGSITGVNGIYSENFDPASKLKIENKGTIEGSVFAIHTFDTKEVVINRGEIHGRINLGGGNDVFDNRNGGTVDHQIEGGTGNDTLITDRASVKLKEDGGSAGYDTIISFVSYTLPANVELLSLKGTTNLNGVGNNGRSDMNGNAGNNRLSALGGNDVLAGGQGNDTLIGGSGADRFVFKTGYDHDTINDFQNDVDEIDLRAWAAITNFADLKAHHLTVDGANLVISAGSDELVLLDTKKSELDASDFLF